MTRIRHITTSNAAAPTASYSQAMAYESLIATGGQVGRDAKSGELAADLREQVDQAIKNLREVLIAAGSDMDHVLKVNCFLANIDDFASFDAVYRTHFKEPFPARSTIGIALAGDLQFEIEAWAVAKERI